MKYINSIVLMAIVLIFISCSKDEETPKPVIVEGDVSAKLEIDDDFVADKITYGPDADDGVQQLFAIETSTNRAIEFLLWGDALKPGTLEIDNSNYMIDLIGYYYLDADVSVSSRLRAISGSYTLKKLDKDSLVAEFNFSIYKNDEFDYLTEGLIKLKLR